MADFNTPSSQDQIQNPAPKPGKALNPSSAPLTGGYDDKELLDLWKIMKTESFDTKWVFERQFQRNIWYVLGRQWIEYQSRYGGWRDKRMAAWVPRPVTNKCKETVTAIRAMFASIELGVNVRPNGSDPLNVSAAATADELAPLLHEVHLMNKVMSEFDFWLCTTGNAFLHTYVDYDIRHGELVITAEQCQGCQTVTDSTELTGAQPICPTCQGTAFAPAMDPLTGAPVERRQAKGVPSTMVLSPLEISFPNSYTRFDDVPYVVRSRWRTKRYFESHPILKDLVPTISWQKSPSDHSLALYTSLTQSNDLGIAQTSWSEGAGRGGANDEGISEHEVWMKPTEAYPDGLVFRIVGDSEPIVVHLEDQEGLPGPLPYHDSEGTPLFTFAHASFDHVGGRILGSGPLDVIIQKQDLLNQLDSYVMLCLARTANPVWLEPKGCEIQKLTGMPGLVVKYKTDPMGSNSKPERLPGIPLDASWMQLREQYLRDIEELAGTFDVIKGQKPSGVEAFSALQLLVERSQARFATVFQSRGEAYRNWVKFALELEREFGPEERTKATRSPARGWTFENYKRTQLEGAMTIIVEDGSTTPKTNLGLRASLEHAASLGMLNLQDPDQQYNGLQIMGITRMAPSLDIHMQAALQKQQAAEEWLKNPQAIQQFVGAAQQQQQAYDGQMAEYDAAQQTHAHELAGASDPNQPMPQAAPPPPQPPSMLVGTPLEWLPWFNAQIHMQEGIKWMNGDRIRELLKTVPITKNILVLHMQDMAAAMAPPPGMVDEGVRPPQGAAMAAANSNQNSAGVGKHSSGSGGTGAPGA